MQMASTEEIQESAVENISFSLPSTSTFKRSILSRPNSFLISSIVTARMRSPPVTGAYDSETRRPHAPDPGSVSDMPRVEREQFVVLRVRFDGYDHRLWICVREERSGQSDVPADIDDHAR
jgi:hypothetical protein